MRKIRDIQREICFEFFEKDIKIDFQEDHLIKIVFRGGSYWFWNSSTV